MTENEIGSLIKGPGLPHGMTGAELVETHISWVLVGDAFVYKIKKPVHYSFLDFSTLKQRKYYCEREIYLNNRLTSGIYLKVAGVGTDGKNFYLDNDQFEPIDYAVKMKKLDRQRQMDHLLKNNRVTETDIENLAKKIAGFHQQADKVLNIQPGEMAVKFNDLGLQQTFLDVNIEGSRAMIENALKKSDRFLAQHVSLLRQRLEAGYYRDCHGDLHTRNIFLLPEPVPFDCLEFNDSFRQMDVLDEIAFLCMDLDAFGREDLSALFLHCYDHYFPVVQSGEEQYLFLYYKAYRANIRAKVNSLRAVSAESDQQRKDALKEAERYLRLMDAYLRRISQPRFG